MKKKLIVVIVIALIAALAAGCSSDSGTDTNTEAGTTAAGTPTETTSQPASTGTGQASARKELPRKFEYSKGTLPKYLEHVLDNGVPVMVGFYKSGDRISETVKPLAKQAAADYKGQIKYFEFTDDNSLRITKLSLALGAQYLPHISIVDRNKNIVFEKSGMTEQDYLEHAIYNVLNRDIKKEADR